MSKPKALKYKAGDVLTFRVVTEHHTLWIELVLGVFKKGRYRHYLYAGFRYSRDDGIGYRGCHSKVSYVFEQERVGTLKLIDRLESVLVMGKSGEEAIEALGSLYPQMLQALEKAKDSSRYFQKQVDRASQDLKIAETKKDIIENFLDSQDPPTYYWGEVEWDSEELEAALAMAEKAGYESE